MDENCEETWKPVKIFKKSNKTEVSNHGRLRDDGKIFLPTLASSGYLYAGNIANRGAGVHILVMEAFCGKRPKYNQVHHKDGDKTNNALSNLEYLERRAHRAIHADGKEEAKDIVTTIRLPKPIWRSVRHLHADGKIKNFNSLVIELLLSYLRTAPSLDRETYNFFLDGGKS